MPDSPVQLNHTEIVVGLAPKLSRPGVVAFDSKDNLYIADTDNHRVLLLSTTGQVTVFAGTGTDGGTDVYAGIDKGGFSGDSGLAISAQLNFPHGLAFDSNDNLYIADSGNHRIRKVGSDGKISTIAGTGEAGFFGDGGAAATAKLNFPRNLAVDTNDNLYFVDTRNNRIRMIDGKGNGNIQTIAGTENGDASTGDGDLATKATLFFNHSIYIDGISIAVDGNGNVFIGQIADHRIRRIDGKDKIIRTFVGGNGQGYSGDKDAATAAKLSYPYGIATDSDGNLYIADADNHRIRKVDDKGIIDTVVGNDISKAEITTPLYGAQSLAFDRHGNLYIAEADYNTVRKINLETPAFSIEMDNPFSVIAVISPETFKKNSESVIATGNIASKYAPYQNTAGGWQLSLVADPPGKDKGTYISFSVHSKAGEDDKVNSCEILAQLQNKYEPASRSSSGNIATSNTVFTKYTHSIAAVKDKGNIALYLDGNQIGDSMPYKGSIDANNSEPLNIGKLMPKPEDKAQQGAIVRKISLWDKALSPTEIINYTNCMMSPKINFPLELDYQVIYNTPKQPDQDFTIQVKGNLSFTGKTGIVYKSDIDKTQKFTPRPHYLDNLRLIVGQKLFKNATLNDLGAFTFEENWDNTTFKVTIKANHPDTSDPQKPQLTAQDTLPYVPDVYDIVYSVIGAVVQKLVEQANQEQKEVIYQYDQSSHQVFAQIEIGKLSNCMGFWNLYGSEQDTGLDASANKNNVSANQRASPNELLTVLPLLMEDQVKDNWCWAASALSIKKFYNPKCGDSQCQLVIDMFQDPLVCRHGPLLGPPKPLTKEQSCNCSDKQDCNYQYQLYEILEKINLYGNWVKTTYSTINDVLEQGRPVGMYFKWADGTGHYAVMSGSYRDNPGNDGSPVNWLVINDSFYGMTIQEMANDTLVKKYQQTGSWEGTYYTQPVWITPPEEASISNQASASS